MKKTYLWTAMLCTAIAFSACKPIKPDRTPQAKQRLKKQLYREVIKTEHGCVGSAGYVWSEVKKDCIRPFEAD